MSSTLLLFGESPPPSEALPDWQPPGMGSPAQVRERINIGLGNSVAWHMEGWGQYGDEHCILEFHVPENEESIVCIMIHGRGLAAVEILSKLALHNGWCLVDESMTLVEKRAVI
jgi:hypothetical protein